MDTVSAQVRSKIMARVKSSGNRSTELALASLLRKHGMSGWRRKYPILGKPDFVFPNHFVAVFVDGCFWHGHPTRCRLPKNNKSYWRRKIKRNKVRDRLVTRALRKKGWKVVRIWENEIPSLRTVRRLRKALKTDVQ